MNKSTIAFAIIANVSITAFASDESLTSSNFIPAKIATSINHTCVLSEQGQVKCWGSNYEGELGIAANTHHGLTTGTMGPNLPTVNLGTNVYAKDLCVGMYSTCVATTDDRIKCWGRNDSGQLGQERDVFDVGRGVNDMGDNLPFTNLGANFKVKSLHCGAYTNCVVSDKGQLKCWGRGYNGELGPNIFPKTSFGRLKDEMGDRLPVVALPIPVKYVSMGVRSTCAASNSDIYCWGSNSSGQAGIGSTDTSIYLPTNASTAIKVRLEDDGVATVIEGISSGNGQSCAIYHLTNRSTEQKVKCWGLNSDGLLGIGSFVSNMGRYPETLGSQLPETSLGLNQIIQIEAHDGFTCALAKNGTLKCWGQGSEGALGIGDTKSRGQNASDMGRQLPPADPGLPVMSISAGAGALSSCAILVNHEIKCWGFGYYGTLGYEDALNRGGKKDDLGENLPYVRYK